MSPEEFKEYETLTIEEIFGRLTQIPPGGANFLKEAELSRISYIFHRLFKDYIDSNNRLAKKVTCLNTILVVATCIGVLFGIITFFLN